jgi:hypothetical protein
VSNGDPYRQRPGVWTTPEGPNVRYTFRLHVVGEDQDDLGGVRGVDRYRTYRVVTPLGEYTAAAIAATVFARQEPGALVREVELIETEHDFVHDATDVRDDASRAR